MCWLSSYVTQKTEWLHVGAVEVKKSDAAASLAQRKRNADVRSLLRG